jgi:excinuclease ABC subunit C
MAPAYNVALRDDKSYPVLKLTVNEKFPRLIMTRRKTDDGAVYYGPYTSAKLLKEALGFIRRIFPLRTCGKMPKSVCLNYHLKQCPGPCVEEAVEGAYRDTVEQLKLFLDGRKNDLIKFLADRMAAASRSQEFEEAARLRSRVEALTAMGERRIRYDPADEVEELKNILGLAVAPDRIEAFDVSNIMGKEAVGSMIYFYKGRPDKNGYRRFRIKTVSGIDDYAMIKEVVLRRYARLLKEKGALPDLIVIDGGRSHLNVVLKELKDMGLGGIPAMGIAKEFEHIYIGERKEPLILPKESKALHLLQRVRDEAHRFAISYHKRLMSKGIRRSRLDDIPGIGPARKRALLERFGSVDGIRAAGFEEILKVPGIDAKSAGKIVGHFKG